MLSKKSTHTEIRIIDSIMGSGKTSWAIQYINEKNMLNTKKSEFLRIFSVLCLIICITLNLIIE